MVDVAIVDAEIPMLLGNNLLKPLEAEIKLLKSGGGHIKLGKVKIEIRETRGGHYTLRVKDLGKLCKDVSSIKTEKSSACYKCDDNSKSKDSLKGHIRCEHAKQTFGSILNNPVKSMPSSQKKDGLCVHKVLTDLNTQLNGKLTKNEESFVLIMKKIARLQIQQLDGMNNCDVCEIENKEKHNLCAHGWKVDSDCKLCAKVLKNENDLSVHEHENNFDEIFLSHHQEEKDEQQECLETSIWDVLLAEEDNSELTEGEKKEVLKLHKYFAHRNGQKLWQNLFQPAGKFTGKKRLIMEFLESCQVCRKYRRTPGRPKVGLPKASDVNEVVSMDLKILKKSGKKEIGILYLHDEFSKLIKGQVINDKNSETIIKGIEKKWIVGGGAGPGHPSRGFFSDNGGEFLNDQLVDFAGALGISIKMTAASSPWMNGSCERNHATVDCMVEKILEDNSKIDLQKAVDLACFVKNTEINKTGFSALQIFCGRSPAFPGLSDCSPASIELEGNNEYLKILRRLDQTRMEARKIDCDQRMKLALKSKINSAVGRTYSFGEPVWFKLESSHKWRSGINLGQDGKVLFIKYANFIRRVPLDYIIPAEEYNDANEEEVNQ